MLLNKNLKIFVFTLLFISIISSKYNTLIDFGFSLRVHDIIFLFLISKLFFESKLTKFIFPQNHFIPYVYLFISYFIVRLIFEDNYIYIRYIFTFAILFLFNSKLKVEDNFFKNEIFIYLILTINLFVFINFIIENYEFNLINPSLESKYFFYFLVRYFDGISTINQMSLFSCFSYIILFCHKKIKFKIAWYLLLTLNILIFRSYVTIVFISIIIGLYIFQKIKLNYLNFLILILIAGSVLTLRTYNIDQNAFYDFKNSSSIMVRNGILKRDLKIAKDRIKNPNVIKNIFGGGAGFIYTVKEEYDDLIRNGINEIYNNQKPWYAIHVKADTTHNIIYQLFFEHGIIGLFIYIYLLYLFIKIFFYFRNFQNETSLIYLLVFTHLHFHMFNPGEIEIFLLLFSILFHNIKSEDIKNNFSLSTNKN